jgi:hypothetical protein
MVVNAMRSGEDMETSVLKQIEQLRRMTVTELRARYREVFGEETRSFHKEFLFRRIAWRIQANAEGGLSERARRRALEIANDADLRVTAPRRSPNSSAPDRAVVGTVSPSPDRRMPLPGTLLRRQFRDKTVVVKVLDDGFEHDGQTYRSLSAIATEVTGTRWNGYAFFGLGSEKRKRAER